MKTAIKQLIENLENDGYQFDYTVIYEALGTEKQQIIDAVIETTQSCLISNAKYLGLRLKFTEEDLESQKQEAEQYYQKTFGNECCGRCIDGLDECINK